MKSNIIFLFFIFNLLANEEKTVKACLNGDKKVHITITPNQTTFSQLGKEVIRNLNSEEPLYPVCYCGKLRFKAQKVTNTNKKQNTSLQDVITSGMIKKGEFYFYVSGLVEDEKAHSNYEERMKLTKKESDKIKKERMEYEKVEKGQDVINERCERLKYRKHTNNSQNVN